MNEDELGRLRHSLLELCSERGYKDLALPALLDRAEVDPEKFHQRFADLEDCFCWVYGEIQDDLFERISAAIADLPDWRARLRTTAYTMLGYLAEDAERAHLLVIDRQMAGERAQRISEKAFAYVFDLVDQAREEGENPAGLTRATAEAIGGTVFLQMYLAFEDDSVAAVREKIPEMMYTAVLPYFGPEAAAEELERTPPELR